MQLVSILITLTKVHAHMHTYYEDVDAHLHPHIDACEHAHEKVLHKHYFAWQGPAKNVGFHYQAC